ncbi:hypothetical protein [Azorhizobium caulinodans]|uniref:hypothetical protein n=1 Tax=Azorhizobium caulinodans TaxID=7 RepID=UPI002FBE761F
MNAAAINMEAAVALATRVAGARRPKAAAIAIPVDQLVNQSCALVALDVTAGFAVDLVEALLTTHDDALPPAAAAARAKLAGALIAIGYATIRTEETPDGSR